MYCLNTKCIGKLYFCPEIINVYLQLVNSSQCLLFTQTNEAAVENKMGRFPNVYTCIYTEQAKLSKKYF